MNGTLNLPASRTVHGVAGLVGAFEDLEPLATVSEHLWHEGQTIEPTRIRVQRPQDLFLAADLHPVTG